LTSRIKTSEFHRLAAPRKSVLAGLECVLSIRCVQPGVQLYPTVRLAADHHMVTQGTSYPMDGHPETLHDRMGIPDTERDHLVPPAGRGSSLPLPRDKDPTPGHLNQDSHGHLVESPLR